MSNPLTPSESKDIADRFRKLLDSDENKDLSQIIEESTLEDEENDQSPIEDKTEKTDSALQVTTDESKSSKILEITKQEEYFNNKTDELIDPDSKAYQENNPSSQYKANYQPPIKLPAIDEYGMPLPGSTQYNNKPSTITRSYPPIQPLTSSRSPEKVPTPQMVSIKQQSPKKDVVARTKRKRRTTYISLKQGMGCILRMFILATLAGIILLLVGGSIVLYEYYNIAATLPSVADLQKKASTFETTRIFDRNGGLLYEILDPSAGRRTYITLDKISPYMVAATIATEDKSFYRHPGFDWTAILRAFWQNYRGGGTISGASTITQQLARGLLFSPEERTEQSYMRKVREALLAAEITRRYTKDQILELYMNEFYYGNLAYGVEAASETYFNITADKLDLAQASFLAGLPQAPSVYDVYHDREAVRERQKQVLTLMYEASSEEGCIYVSNSPQKICVDATSAVDAYTALENYQFNPPDVQIRYPHWVNYVRSILESQFDAQTIYRSGFSVYTTIDPVLQDEAEKLVKQQIYSLSAYNANDGALVAIQPSNGEILAMVGSADFYNDAIDGQVNMATSPTRQPGSSIKPITYIAAFEKGWTPATLIWDVPTEFPPSGVPNDPSPPYIPVNYDGRFHGPVTVRSALANSYNIPAVKTLQFAGIYDDPNTNNEEGMLSIAKKLGITSLTRPDYGLSLTLGGGEVSLLEMTGAYSVIANAGNRMPPTAITRILDHNGNIVFESNPNSGNQVIRPEHAFLISSIMSDNEARTPMFGANSVLNLPFQAAVKTGTSNDFRDNWTLGYTPDIAVGVWVGNADYTPMQDITGVTGAAPIWSEFMQFAIQIISGGNPTPFTKPSGIVDRVICTVSGSEPSQWCTSQRSEYFAADQLPLPSSADLWTKVALDTWTGLRASSACPDFSKDEFAINVTDPWAIGWIQNNPDGKAWVQEMGFSDPIRFVPSRDCQTGDPRPIIELLSPNEGQTITTSPFDITGKLDASGDFLNYTLEYGMGDNPVEWNEVFVGNQPISQPGIIYSWDLKLIPAGISTLKIRMQSIRGGYAERLLHLNIQVSTPTPTITPTTSPTQTPTPTRTQLPTQTFTPPATLTEIPSVTPSATQTSVVTESPSPTYTPPPDFSRP
jgi:penicillin-binding protein 1C